MDIAQTLTVFLGIVFYVSSQTTKTEMTFSCQRPTTPCKNSGTCKSTGQCHCAQGTYGLQCEITASEQDLNVADCLEANPCVNNGRCYFDQGTKAVACFCPAGYYGAHCQFHMLDVDCSDDKMRVYVLPWGYDKGTWTLGNPTITGTTAQLPPVEDFAAITPDFKPLGRKGFVGDFLHVLDPAAGSASVEFEDAQTITYSRGVQVVYSAKGSSPIDQELKVSCMVAKPPTDQTVTTSQPAAGPGSGGVTPQAPPPTVTMPPVSAGFHCQRPSTPCHPESGGCSQFSGQCQCGAARTGLQCTVLVADVKAGACRTIDPCIPERGLCYDSGGLATCTCSDGYYGQLCQHEMAHTECDKDQMVVNIFPYGFDEATWPASLRPSLSHQNTVCKMKTVQEFLAANPAYTGRGFQGFADTYLHVADPCAGDATVVSDNVTTTVYSRQISISYSTLASHHTDQLITVTCSVEKNSAAARPDATLPANTPPTASVTDAPPAQIDTGTGTGTGVSPAPSLPSGSILPLGPAVTQPPSVPGQLPSNSQGPGFGFAERLAPPRVLITLTDEDGMPIRGMVKLGSMVKATFSLDPYSSRDVTDIRVDSCVVTDHVSGENVVVVENGCVHRPMGMLLYRQGRGTRVLIVKIYKFSTSADLSFRCRVYLCRQGDASCWAAPSCSIRFRRSLNGILTDTYKHVTAVEARLTGH